MDEPQRYGSFRTETPKDIPIMVEINLPNAVTIGLIAIVALALIRFVAKTAGKASPV